MSALLYPTDRASFTLGAAELAARLLWKVRKMTRLVWGLLTIHVLAVGPVFSQADENSDISSNFRFTASVNAVQLNVSVIDKNGKLITNLAQKDFRIFEDELAQEITYFSKSTEAPVDVVLLVDASGSMDVTEKVANARNAAIQLIHSLGPEDRVSVYAFDKDLYQLTEFEESKQESIAALTRITPFGSTALYDAVAILADHVVHEGFGRRAIVVVTDGVDTASDISVDEAVEKARGVDLPVYAVRVLSPIDDPKNDLFLGVHGAEFRGEDALRRFTAATGGDVYEGSQWGQLAMASARIREELKTQYRIGYVPDNPRRDAGFRSIRVLTRRRGVEVRTREGYYPKKTQSKAPPPRSAIEERSYY
jgi:Ca-activated chloride channel family protein